MDEKAMIAMFHTMYDNFPTRVRLIKKDRTVLAVNKVAEAEGLTPGVRCIDQGPLEGHKNCLANQALQEQCGKCRFWENGVTFWAPLEGCEDVYVHGSFAKDRPNPLENGE